MRVKQIVDEVFQDYKKTSMLLVSIGCTWKCCKEGGFPVEICQNSLQARLKTVKIPKEEVLERYLSNPLTQAVVVGGLEPFDQFWEVLDLLSYFRSQGVSDDFVIYTGYTESEVDAMLKLLTDFPNVVIKFGRYIPDTESVFDEVLGVRLASKNQYAVKVS
jgi:hypothetical protein